MRVLRIAIVTFFVAASGGAAQRLERLEMHGLLDEANAWFQKGNDLSGTDPDAARDCYGKAILRFERIVQEGGVRNGKLYYNLGNAYFLTGDMGRSILNYLRAEQYIPNDPNLHQALAHVRNQRTDRIEEPQRTRVLKTVFFWHYDVASSTRMILFAVCFVVFWICAGIRLFRKNALLKWMIVGTAALSLFLFASVTIEHVSRVRNPAGVMIADATIARKGNSETYEPSFQEPLHAGAEFGLIETRGEWRQIRLGDGRTCWIPRDSAQLVRTAP